MDDMSKLTPLYPPKMIYFLLSTCVLLRSSPYVLSTSIFWDHSPPPYSLSNWAWLPLSVWVVSTLLVGVLPSKSVFLCGMDYLGILSFKLNGCLLA